MDNGDDLIGAFLAGVALTLLAVRFWPKTQKTHEQVVAELEKAAKDSQALVEKLSPPKAEAPALVVNKWPGEGRPSK